MQDPESIVLVTGGSGGIGREIVQALIHSGFSVWNLDKVRPEAPILQETFREIDFSQAIFVLERTIAKTLSETKGFGEVYGLVHCAGYGGPYHDITKVGLEEWQSIFRINVDTFFLLVKSLLPGMKARKMGRIVSIASSLASIGAKNSVAYSASKHALLGLVRSLADEWGPDGITFNTVSPGYVDTKMGVQEDQVKNHRQQIINKTPVKRLAEPAEIARIVDFLMQKESGYITGANWAVDGGLTAI